MNREMRNVNVAAQAREIRFSLQSSCFVLIAALPSTDAKRRLTLWDIREPMLTIVCQPCGRRGRFSVARVIEKHGDAKIRFVLPALTNCPKTQSANIYDRCKARDLMGWTAPLPASVCQTVVRC